MEEFEKNSTSSIPLIDKNLPKQSCGGIHDLFLWEGFWIVDVLLEPIMEAKSSFKALNDDVILASPVKAGSTWLKALIPTIMNYGLPGDHDPLTTHHPNQLMPILEISHNNNLYSNGSSPRLFRTHTPYPLLAESAKTSTCKMVYIARDPKDVVVSLWHFMNAQKPLEKGNVPFEELFEDFCDGVNPFGPFHDHVIGYWEESLKRPEKILFLKYEDLKRDTKGEVKKLALFLGRPFVNEEDVDKVVSMCSIERLKGLAVNKNGADRVTGLRHSSFFRKGVVGDWETKLTVEMKEKIDKLTREKLKGTGLSL